MMNTTNMMQDEAQSAATDAIPAEALLGLLSVGNIADHLDDGELSDIGSRVKREYELDEGSRADWKKTMEEALKIANQVKEEKTWPWPNASNVKYPLITTAAVQFAARAYPAIVQGKDVVKGKVNGRDDDGQKQARADRVSRHMSWQLLEEMEDWEEDTDKLLHILPITGTVYRKSYYSKDLGRNVSELCLPDRVVVNEKAKSKDMPRFTHLIDLYPYQITERIRAGVYRDFEYSRAGEDEDAPQTFLEQHRRLDLDDDGYPEPYIVTVHQESCKVVRIVPCFDPKEITINQKGEVVKIKPREYFTKYVFLPSFDGGWHGIGFGQLLNPINEAVNTTMNQMLDAGTLANTGGGFISSNLKLAKGQGSLRFGPGEYKRVQGTASDIRQSVMNLPFEGPSPQLFNLLGLLIEAGREIASIKDVMTGAESSNMPATTTMALIEQGMKVYSAIFKRIHRSLKQELRKLFDLNRMFLQPEVYFTLLDDPESVQLQDYNGEDLDIGPVSDPAAVSESHKLIRAQALMEMKDDPYLNPMEIRKRYLIAIGEEGIDNLLVEPPEQGPDPKVLEMGANLELKKSQEMREAEKHQVVMENLQYEGALTKAKAMKESVDAEAQAIENQAVKSGLQQIVEQLSNGQAVSAAE